MAKGDIVGHKLPLRVLERTIREGRIPHALLFEGPEGIGKKKVALWFIEALNCRRAPGEGCGSCEQCERIQRLSHPDLHLLTLEGESIRIEQIREATNILRFRPLEGRWKALVVEDAERMTPEASNAFLKTLEEPTPWTLIILIAQSADALLPTVRSRCQRIRFFPLKEGEVREVLERLGVQAPPSALRWGSPGKAIRMLQEDFEALLLKAKEGGLSGIFDLGEELGRDRERAIGFLQFLLQECRRKLEENSLGFDKFWRLLHIYRCLEEYANARLCVEAALLEMLHL